MRKTAILYSRVSTKAQQKTLFSQEHALVKFAFYNQIISNRSIKEVCSGKSTPPLLQDSIDYLGKDNFMIVKDVTRLGRNYHDTLEFVEKVHQNDSSIFSINDNLYSRNNTFKILIKQSEEEFNLINQRRISGHQWVRDNDGYLGRPRYGQMIYRDSDNVPRLQENPEHTKFINILLDMYYYGKYSIEEIVEQMNKLDSTKHWTRYSVKNIIENN